MNFIKWLQTMLQQHGFYMDGKIDGDWGKGSITALQAFQRSRGLSPTGVADTQTVNALKTRNVQDPPAPPAERELMPPWMAEMYRRLGLNEVRDNKTLSEWLRTGKFLGNPAKLPWCGDAIETCIYKTLPNEPAPSNPFFAQSWAKFGIDAGGPIVGSIGVIRWSPSSGHVGIVAGIDGNRVIMIGGNQSNAITISSFPLDKFIAFRWPKTYPVRRYPALKGSAAPLLTAGSTR